jgi:hypothetical protein
MIPLYSVFFEDYRYGGQIFSETALLYTTLSCKDAIRYIDNFIKTGEISCNSPYSLRNITYPGYKEVWSEVSSAVGHSKGHGYVVLRKWHQDSGRNLYLTQKSDINGLKYLYEEYPSDLEDIIKFASSIMSCDPIALDMARDVLKI